MIMEADTSKMKCFISNVKFTLGKQSVTLMLAVQ